MGVLAICGSLRAASSNLRLLQTAATLTPLTIYNELAALPPFNPDDNDFPPEVVSRWRAAVRSADALLISTPEYAHGLPGALKNALDWLVSEQAPISKRVAVWNAANRKSEYAYPQLIEILRTMNMRVVLEASLLSVSHDEATLRSKLLALLSPDPIPNGIIEADLSITTHADAVLHLLDVYSRDTMANGSPLPLEISRTLISALRVHPTTVVFLAFRNGAPIGMALCFVGFSSFAAKPLLNIHDLVVVQGARNAGIGRLLIAAVEQKARALGCAKLTLEVMDNNTVAHGLYQRLGFNPYSLDANKSTLLMMQKKLGDDTP